MEFRASKYIKVAISLLIVLGIIFGFSFLFNAKANFVQSTQLSSNEASNNAYDFQHLYLSADQSLQSSNVPTESFGQVTLKDFDVETQTDFYIIIAFVNFSSGSADWTQSDIDEVMQYFNDDDPNNGIYSVYEYMYDQSYGKIRMKAGYVTGETPSTYNDFASLDTDANSQTAFKLETQTYDEALRGKQVTIDGQVIDTFHCRILCLPCDSTEWGTSTWPHAWMNRAMIVTCKSMQLDGGPRMDGPFAGTYSHELTHVLGVPDLYPYGTYIVDPVGDWFIMGSTDYYYPQTINAYYRELLGFVDSSHIYDNNETKIEEISSSGTYTLSPANSDEGTLALTFGERATTVKNNQTGLNESATEYFYVEYKKSTDSNSADRNIPENGLIIYRVVESETLLEDGNMHPSYTSAKYQIYVFRLDNANSALFASVGVGESFGNLSSNAKSNTICYYDGTNSQVKITNVGLNEDGQVEIKVEFSQNLYSASGELSYNGEKVDGARIYVATYNSITGKYNIPQATDYYTDENGYFFVPDLQSKTKISFVKTGYTINSELEIVDKDIIGAKIDEQGAKDVTFHFFENNGGTEVALQGVNVYSEDSELLGTSDIDGNVTVNIMLNDKLTFELDSYTFSSFTFIDFNTTNYRIQGSTSLGSQTMQLSIKDGSGAVVTDFQIYDVTNADSPTIKSYETIGNLIKLDAYEGMVIKIVSNDYAPYTFTVETTDLEGTKQIVLSAYKELKVKVIARDNTGKDVNLSDVFVYVDDVFIGVTDGYGELVISKIYAGQTVKFVHSVYLIDDYVYDGLQLEKQINTNKFKPVKVYIEFYKPEIEGQTVNDPNELLVNIQDYIDKISLSVSGNPSILSVEDNKLCFDAVYYADIIFGTVGFAITDESGVIIRVNDLNDKLHSYGSFIIDPTKAIEQEDGYVTYKLYLKQYLTLSGKVEFPSGVKAKTVNIYVNSNMNSQAQTNELNEFTLTNILEGDKIIFKCEGFLFEDYYATNSTNNNDLLIKAKVDEGENYLGIYILFGILVILFIVPFFIRLKPKKKYLDKI